MDDAVQRYQRRRDERVSKKSRKDDDDETGGGGKGNGANTRLPFGIAKGKGIDTEGMSPREVWDALKGEGVSPSGEYAKLKSRGEATKTVTKTSPKAERERAAHETEAALSRAGYERGESGIWEKKKVPSKAHRIGPPSFTDHNLDPAFTGFNYSPEKAREAQRKRREAHRNQPREVVSGEKKKRRSSAERARDRMIRRIKEYNPADEFAPEVRDKGEYTTMEDDMRKQGYKKNKEGRWVKSR